MTCTATAESNVDKELSPVSWHVRLAIKPDQRTNFQRLTGEMVQSTRSERGVLSYQRFISSDGQFVHLYECYSDSSTALTHLITFGQIFGERFATMAERQEFIVYGRPSAELRHVLSGFGAQYMAPFGEFAYWP